MKNILPRRLGSWYHVEIKRGLLRNNGLTFPLIKNEYIYTQNWALSWVIQNTNIGNNPRIREWVIQYTKIGNNLRIEGLQLITRI